MPRPQGSLNVLTKAELDRRFAAVEQELAELKLKQAESLATLEEKRAEEFARLYKLGAETARLLLGKKEQP